jgi:adenylate kinase
VVTGTPGTGKTTVSKLLAKRVGARYLSLSRLVISRGLYSSVDRERRTKVIDFQTARPTVGEVLKEKNEVTVIDTHVPDAVPRGQVNRVMVLRCHPTVLETRLRKKGWSAIKIRENILAEILDACYTTATQYYGARKIFQLDNSKADVRKCVREAEQILSGKPSRKITIDWIRDLKREGLLEKYTE